MPPKPMEEWVWASPAPRVHDEANDPVAARRKELEAMIAARTIPLDNELGDAVKNGDLGVAQAAFAKGAEPTLYYINSLTSDDLDWHTVFGVPKCVSWVIMAKEQLSGTFDHGGGTCDDEEGDVSQDVYPTICAAANVAFKRS